jgi:hypothetical protein
MKKKGQLFKDISTYRIYRTDTQISTCVCDCCRHGTLRLVHIYQLVCVCDCCYHGTLGLVHISQLVCV